MTSGLAALARRAGRWGIPSLLAAGTGALAAGLVDGCASASEIVPAVGAAGFVAAVLLPILLAASLLARAIVRAWRPAELADATAEAPGSHPRFAAWSLYAFAALAILAGATYAAVLGAAYRTPAKLVQALASAIAIGALGVVLLVAAVPTVRLLTSALRSLDRRPLRTRGRGLTSPRIVLSMLGVVAAIASASIWRIGVAPRIGHLDLTPYGFVAIGGAVFGLSHAASPWLARRRATRPVAVALAVALAAAGGAALWLRLARPYAMLALWGDAPLAGPAIDALVDVHAMRSELAVHEFRPPARPGATPRDVVLITIDSFRADRAPIYGGPVAMPALSRLAGRAAVFQWAFAPGNVTRRSLPSIATGLSPNRVRGVVTGWALKLDPRHIMFAERLRAAGYATAGFFCCGSHFGADRALGLERGFERIVIDKDGSKLAAAAAAWRATPNDGRPRFAWFHFIEPHGWVDADAAQPGDRPTDRYDRTLVEVDRDLDVIARSFLDDAGRGRTYLVVTADHGEALGDHGARTHATDLYNSQIKVPLVIAGPDVAPGRVLQNFGLVDLAPTLLDLAGFVPPAMPQMDGASRAPLLRGEVAPDLASAEAYAVMVRDRSVAASAWALIRGRHKLILDARRRSPELYDLGADPHERKNLFATQPALAEEMRRHLAARRDRDRVPPF